MLISSDLGALTLIHSSYSVSNLLNLAFLERLGSLDWHSLEGIDLTISVLLEVHIIVEAIKLDRLANLS